MRIMVAVTALLVAAPAAAEVVESSGDHFVTRDSAVVKTAPKATWLALIEPAAFWSKAHSWSGDAKNLSLTPQAGGCFCERLPAQDTDTDVGLAGSAQHMTVVMAEPMKVLRMRGALGPLQSEPVDGVLTVTLQPDKASGGTKIVWEYVVAGHMRFEVAKISKAVDGVMSEQLELLADKLGRHAEPSKVESSGEPIKPLSAVPAKPVTKPQPAAASAARTSAEKAASAAKEAAQEGPAPDDVGAALDAMEKDRGKPQ